VYDRFNREINYLRISVTDRCNLRCRYCMPEEGIKLLRHEEILSFDEITDFTKVAVHSGFRKLIITGGEHLLWKGIATLVKMIAGIAGIIDLSITTNGILMKAYAYDLKRSGLNRVNISLDTTDPVKFFNITRGGKISDVIDGIEAARKAELLPVKINCVIKESSEEPDAVGVTDYCLRNDLEIRYIKQMDLVHGHFFTVDGGTGGDCALCNRLRLTANGKLIPCLFSDIRFDIRELGYKEALNKAIDFKPECGSKNITGGFYNIGG
jgi:cyclic pyranopterin phosphate synthase